MRMRPERKRTTTGLLTAFRRSWYSLRIAFCRLRKVCCTSSAFLSNCWRVAMIVFSCSCFRTRTRTSVSVSVSVSVSGSGSVSVSARAYAQGSTHHIRQEHLLDVVYQLVVGEFQLLPLHLQHAIGYSRIALVSAGHTCTRQHTGPKAYEHYTVVRSHR